MDTTSLRQGYAELIAEARLGGFRQPRAMKVQAGHHLPAHLAQLRALRV